MEGYINESPTLSTLGVRFIDLLFWVLAHVFPPLLNGQNLFSAGTDTSSSIIEWAMAEMLYNPAILQRAQAEMDAVIGRDRRLQESDLTKLPYLQAICKETFRKHPSTPLNLPRVATQQCEVDGYYIPKGTTLMVNIWGIGRDPSVWPNPLEFDPDRFLSPLHSKIDPRGNNFELIPFGAGRRICAGTRMGIVMVEYILGSLVHGFDWKMPEGEKTMDMSEAFGLALQKAVPVKAVATPRLAPHVYAEVDMVHYSMLDGSLGCMARSSTA